jgi:hypothetical protein
MSEPDVAEVAKRRGLTQRRGFHGKGKRPRPASYTRRQRADGADSMHELLEAEGLSGRSS